MGEYIYVTIPGRRRKHDIWYSSHRDTLSNKKRLKRPYISSVSLFLFALSTKKEEWQL